jgi:hypothetical protein
LARRTPQKRHLRKQTSAAILRGQETFSAALKARVKPRFSSSSRARTRRRALVRARPPSTFKPEGSWTLVELIQASAEVWMDLAEVEPDASIADGYRAMARDLDRYADMLEPDP